MYTDLAHAVEDMKSRGIESITNDDELGEKIRSGIMPEKMRNMNIVETHQFDSGSTNPEDESTLYLLELPDKSRKYLILSFGMYKDLAKSNFIDELKKLEQL